MPPMASLVPLVAQRSQTSIACSIQGPGCPVHRLLHSIPPIIHSSIPAVCTLPLCHSARSRLELFSAAASANVCRNCRSAWKRASASSCLSAPSAWLGTVISLSPFFMHRPSSRIHGHAPQGMVAFDAMPYPARHQTLKRARAHTISRPRWRNTPSSFSCRRPWDGWPGRDPFLTCMHRSNCRLPTPDAGVFDVAFLASPSEIPIIIAISGPERCSHCLTAIYLHLQCASRSVLLAMHPRSTTPASPPVHDACV
ncbi:hypothetical protein BCR34DRAFT_232978 [Clohesyomyces aquaticus]|uniref:Uncharacterized protein n=1 Tax=Clohesyomyces aquaticus TaxID=1231657 RepID=A0A1Y1ZW83_9PLEO|nr:hypothetical protein BCR34DRAFT_232978 [Clohesyomyces aquaticus]